MFEMSNVYFAFCPDPFQEFFFLQIHYSVTIHRLAHWTLSGFENYRLQTHTPLCNSDTPGMSAGGDYLAKVVCHNSLSEQNQFGDVNGGSIVPTTLMVED